MKCLRCGAGNEWIAEDKVKPPRVERRKWVDWIASGPHKRTKLHAVEDANDTHTLCGARIIAGKKFHPRPEPINLMMRGNPVGSCYWCWRKA